MSNSVNLLLRILTDLNSPDGEMCLQEILGSGFPLAEQMSETLLPSFTVMSDEMS